MWIAIFLTLQAQSGELPPVEDLLPKTASYTTTVKWVYEIHEPHSRTLYCDCSYLDKVPNLPECGLEGWSGLRWERTEVEHVVPLSTIGSTRPCWEEGGRNLCQKVDPVFRSASTDLHNLWPSVGGINNARSNKAPGIFTEGEGAVFGTCPLKMDADRVEPRAEVRGDIARIYFYMEWMYGVPINEGQRRLFHHWHRTDPVDVWERTRNERIQEKQGNTNPFVQ